MKNIFTIVKKEFARFFKDRRMVLSIILPGLMIYIVYSLMGTFMADMFAPDDDYKPKACLINTTAEMSSMFGSIFELQEGLTEETAKASIKDGKTDVAIIFPDNFDPEATGRTQNVRVYYDSAKDNSLAGYNITMSVFETIKKSSFTVNAADGVKFDLAESDNISRKMLSILIPMVVFSFLAAGSMAVAPEAIAGEKERGTMATILITPVDRWKIAVGKVVSLTCFALLSGMSSFIGLILSLPKLTAGMLDMDISQLYGVGDYFALLGVIISIVLVIISIFSVMSCFARSVKEAGSLISPFMIVIILLGVASMIIPSNAATGLFLIPMVGSGLAMSGIMMQTVSSLQIALSICSNLVLAVLLIVLLAFMFKSERIMFKA